MSAHELALEALRSAAMHVEDLQREKEGLEQEVALLAIGGSSSLVLDLVRIARRAPEWNFGHLHTAEFEAIRARLDVPPVDVRLSAHDDGHCYYIIEVEREGLRLRAQRTAPGPRITYADERGAAEVSP